MKRISIDRAHISDLKFLLNRGASDYEKYEVKVREILEDIRVKGDSALLSYTKEFDGADMSDLVVSTGEIEEACRQIDEKFAGAVERAVANIEKFHRKQLRNTWIDCDEFGCITGQKVIPLSRVGVYVPGGKAAYPSSVLMNVIPARVAGVGSIIMVTPPDREGKINPYILFAAHRAGVDKIYKCGGAQAVGALAYGTETVTRVDKIVGPGNIYVALAKKTVYGIVGVDSVAGPSEILVLADETANPGYVAADLLSQAEHDELSSSVLVTDSEDLAKKVSEEIKAQTRGLSRRNIVERSLGNYGLIVLVPRREDMIAAANEIASEHLEIQMKDPFEVMAQIQHAGAIFIGDYACEPVGDYFAGPNHVLPTNGTARFFSPLSVDDFIKKSSIIYYTDSGLAHVHDDVECFARAEGLTAHENAVKIRFEQKSGRDACE